MAENATTTPAKPKFVSMNADAIANAKKAGYGNKGGWEAADDVDAELADGGSVSWETHDSTSGNKIYKSVLRNAAGDVIATSNTDKLFKRVGKYANELVKGVKVPAFSASVLGVIQLPKGFFKGGKFATNQAQG